LFGISSEKRVERNAVTGRGIGREIERFVFGHQRRRDTATFDWRGK